MTTGLGRQAGPRPRRGAGPRKPSRKTPGPGRLQEVHPAGGDGANSLRGAGSAKEDPLPQHVLMGCRVGCEGATLAYRSRGPTPAAQRRLGGGQGCRSPGSRWTGSAAGTSDCWGRTSCDSVCFTVRTGSTRGGRGRPWPGRGCPAATGPHAETFPFKSETAQRRPPPALWSPPSGNSLLMC